MKLRTFRIKVNGYSEIEVVAERYVIQDNFIVFLKDKDTVAIYSAYQLVWVV